MLWEISGWISKCIIYKCKKRKLKFVNKTLARFPIRQNYYGQMSTLFFRMLRKILPVNSNKARSSESSLIFTRVSFLLGEKNSSFRGKVFNGAESVMTVITRWILMHFSILDISYGSLKVPRTAPNGWTYVRTYSLSLFFLRLSLFPPLSFPLLASHSTFSLCFSLNFYLHETCGQVFRVSHSFPFARRFTLTPPLHCFLVYRLASA